MKWFKHYSNASTSAKLNVIMDKHGVDGYGKYWLLVELLADKFDGKEATFQIHFSTIKQRLRGYHDKITRRFLEDLNESQLMSIECTNNLYTIHFPKLLEIKDNHTRNLQAKTKAVAPRKEKKRKEKKTSSDSLDCGYDLNLIYSCFPKKQGKQAGMKKLHSIINSQEKFEQILLGAQHYAQYCKDNDTHMKYIKQFSTWVNQECWEDDIKLAPTQEELEKEFIDLIGGE